MANGTDLAFDPTWEPPVFTELWKERSTKKDVADALNLPYEEISNLLFGLEGQYENEDNQSGAKLRLV